MTYGNRNQSQTLHRCASCKEWLRAFDGWERRTVCSRCGEVYIPVPNTGPPRFANPETRGRQMDT